MFWRKDREKRGCNKGSITVEASLILVIFLAAYIAILSVVNIFLANMIVQNSVNQAAKEISEYSYIIKKAGLDKFGSGTSERADKFMGESEEMIKTVMTFFHATSDGLDTAKQVYSSAQEYQYPKDEQELVEQLKDAYTTGQTVAQKVEKVKNAANEMMNRGEAYFSSPENIFNGILAILRDGANDSIKMAIAAPISKGLTEKYLSAYPDDYLQKLGVIGGKAGINYIGSSILLDYQSIEVSASYKMKIEVPFFDRFTFNMRNTADTRAWIGDGSYNENTGGITPDAENEGGAGSKLSKEATGVPGVKSDAVDSGTEEEPSASTEPSTSAETLLATASNSDTEPSTQSDTSEETTSSSAIPREVDIPMSSSNIASSEEVRNMLDDIGYTQAEFNTLITKPFDDLTNEEFALIQYARLSFPDPVPEKTEMCKVITKDDFEHYMLKNEDRYKEVRGFVARKDDVVNAYGTYDNMRDSLRLDYKIKNRDGSFREPYPEGGNEYYYMEFKFSKGAQFDIPLRKEYGGKEVIEEGNPLTGNGFIGSKNGNVIPEWTVKGRAGIENGAKVYRVMDGKKTLIAIKIDGYFKPVETE